MSPNSFTCLNFFWKKILEYIFTAIQYHKNLYLTPPSIFASPVLLDRIPIIFLRSYDSGLTWTWPPSLRCATACPAQAWPLQPLLVAAEWPLLRHCETASDPHSHWSTTNFRHHATARIFYHFIINTGITNCRSINNRRDINNYNTRGLKDIHLTLEVTNDNFHGVHRLALYIVAFLKNHCIANTGPKNINKIPLCC